MVRIQWSLAKEGRYEMQGFQRELLDCPFDGTSAQFDLDRV
jgi:hypothetical protein